MAFQGSWCEGLLPLPLPLSCPLVTLPFHPAPSVPQSRSISRSCSLYPIPFSSFRSIHPPPCSIHPVSSILFHPSCFIHAVPSHAVPPPSRPLPISLPYPTRAHSRRVPTSTQPNHRHRRHIHPHNPTPNKEPCIAHLTQFSLRYRGSPLPLPSPTPFHPFPLTSSAGSPEKTELW